MKDTTLRFAIFLCGLGVVSPAPAAAAVQHGSLRAGAARVDITPPGQPGVSALRQMVGQMARDAGSPPENVPRTPVNCAIFSNDTQTYRTNHAKTGGPHGAGLPAWPKYDTKARRYLEFTGGGPVGRRTCAAHLEKRTCAAHSVNSGPIS